MFNLARPPLLFTEVENRSANGYRRAAEHSPNRVSHPSHSTAQNYLINLVSGEAEKVVQISRPTLHFPGKPECGW
jgi:hypothetical protein